MRRAARALSFCVLAALAGQQASAQTILTDRLGRTLASAPLDSLLPILIEWEEPARAPAAVGVPPVAALRASLENALKEREGRLRAFVGARGLGAEFRGKAPLWIASASVADATPAAIAALTRLPGVRRIYLDDLIRVEGLRPAASALPEPSFVPWGVALVGAPELWQAGLTGKGRLVAILDSGVDVRHPLLSPRWRGRFRSARESWFDPFSRSVEPVDDVGHGTLVATVAVGALQEGDTLLTAEPIVARSGTDVASGVAPEAEWMAANVFEVLGSDVYTRRSIILQAMQWLLDPDGDPETSDDVPDVVNNSWGEIPEDEEGFCTGIYHRAIDALERAGVAVIFSAGNRGPINTVPPPASRADLLTNAFAVGAVEPLGDSVVVPDFSLGGPSPCGDGTSVKPEVVAPGRVPSFTRAGDRSIRSSGQASGTSFSAPHVSGAVALLRQASPGAGSDAVKRALLETSRDLPPLGPDNRSGNGLIDLLAATRRVAGPLPGLLRVSRWELHGANAFFTLANVGDAALPGATARLAVRSSDRVLGASTLPPLNPGDTARIGPYHVGVLEPGREVRVDLLVVRGGDREIRFPLVLRSSALAGSEVLRDGAALFGLDGAGRYGRVAAPSGFSLNGSDPLTGAALLVSSGGRVSDVAYVDVQGNPANKTRPAATDTDWQGRGGAAGGTNRSARRYDDDQALRPLGVAVDEQVELVSQADTAAYALLTFRLSSRSGRPLTVGLFADWDFERDTVYWSPSLGALVTRAAGEPSRLWAAVAAGEPVAAAAAVPLGRRDGPTSYAPGSGVLADSLRVFDDGQKAAFLLGSGRSSSTAGADDWAGLLAVGPAERLPREVGAADDASVTFVLALARSEAGLAAALSAARARTAIPNLPGRSLVAASPFPNPFEPLRSGSIRFPFQVGPELREAGAEAIFEIFTITGRPVVRVRASLDPGAILEPFEWDGRTADGELAASGFYLYRIRVGRQVARGKFILLK